MTIERDAPTIRLELGRLFTLTTSKLEAVIVDAERLAATQDEILGWMKQVVVLWNELLEVERR